MTDQLPDSRPRLDEEAQLAAMQAFIAIASHELRNPISGMVGAAETLNSGWDQLAEGERRQLVAVMLRQSRRLSGLVDELLELSRLEAGAVQVSARPVKVAAEAEAAAEEVGVADIAVAAAPELVVIADPNHLRRILINLLVNAAKHGAPPIVVAAEPTGRQVELQVVDRGPGVPAEFVPRLFDRFSRAMPGPGQRAAAEGAGLGLAIVDGLARLSGGEAFYRPAPSGGAVFGVRLPAG